MSPLGKWLIEHCEELGRSGTLVFETWHHCHNYTEYPNGSASAPGWVQIPTNEFQEYAEKLGIMILYCTA